jgi:hypothetical protein
MEVELKIEGKKKRVVCGRGDWVRRRKLAKLIFPLLEHSQWRRKSVFT